MRTVRALMEIQADCLRCRAHPERRREPVSRPVFLPARRNPQVLRTLCAKELEETEFLRQFLARIPAMKETRETARRTLDSRGIRKLKSQALRRDQTVSEAEQAFSAALDRDYGLYTLRQLFPPLSTVNQRNAEFR